MVNHQLHSSAKLMVVYKYGCAGINRPTTTFQDLAIGIILIIWATESQFQKKYGATIMPNSMVTSSSTDCVKSTITDQDEENTYFPQWQTP